MSITWKAGNDEFERKVSFELEHACLLLADIEVAFNFNDFVMWYRAQLEQAERYKQDNISELHSDPLSDLSSNMWLMRFAEAKKNYEKILTLIKNGTLTASTSEYVSEGIIRETFFISRLELQKYCCEYHLFPSFLLPFDPNIVSERIVDELEHVIELRVEEEQNLPDSPDDAASSTGSDVGTGNFATAATLKTKIKELEKRLGETEKKLNEYLCLEDEN